MTYQKMTKDELEACKAQLERIIKGSAHARMIEIYQNELDEINLELKKFKTEYR